jgi:hypothetical protein
LSNEKENYEKFQDFHSSLEKNVKFSGIHAKGIFNLEKKNQQNMTYYFYIDQKLYNYSSKLVFSSKLAISCVLCKNHLKNAISLVS